MSDIALIWSDSNAGDIATADFDLLTDEGLRTAVIISLFSDRRASGGEELPAGEISRRGWWGDVAPEVPGDAIGSRLWLLFREKQLPEVLTRANEYARDALQWLIDDKVASRVDVLVESTEFQRLDIQVTIYRDGKDDVHFRFGSAWTNETADDEIASASQQPSGMPAPRLNLDFTQGVMPGGVQFTRNSVATYFDAAGVLRTAASHAPRFDYDPLTKEIRGLLIEEARTNLAIYSVLRAPGWSSGGSPVQTVNYGLAPDGSNESGYFAATAANTQPYVLPGGTATVQYVSGTAYTSSVWLKSNPSMPSVRVRLYLHANVYGVTKAVYFDVSTGAVSIVAGSTVPESYGFEAYGNGWVRLWATQTATVSATSYPPILWFFDPIAPGEGVEFWGMQVEAGASPTSYIATNGAAATRAADVASMPSAPWHNPFEGAYFIEADVRAFGSAVSTNTFPHMFSLMKGASLNAGDYFAARISQPNSIQGIIGNYGTYTTATLPGVTTIGARERIALSGDASGNIICRNGAIAGALSGARWPAYVDTLWIGSRGGIAWYWNGHIRRIQHYRKRLPDSYLQQLTA